MAECCRNRRHQCGDCGNRTDRRSSIRRCHFECGFCRHRFSRNSIPFRSYAYRCGSRRQSDHIRRNVEQYGYRRDNPGCRNLYGFDCQYLSQQHRQHHFGRCRNRHSDSQRRIADCQRHTRRRQSAYFRCFRQCHMARHCI